MLHFHLRACPKCQGDLALDEGDWLCLQCGTYYYTRLYRTPVPFPVPSPKNESRVDDRSGDRREKAVSRLTSAVQGLSQFRDLSTTVSRFGETTEIGSDALGLAAGSMTGYDHR